MAILDLQAMEPEVDGGPEEGKGGSHGSKGCGNSGLCIGSVLCDVL